MSVNITMKMRVVLLLMFLGYLSVTHAQNVLQPDINITDLLTGLEKLKDMETRLLATETMVVELKQMNQDLLDELQVVRSMEARLKYTEDQVKKLQRNNSEGHTNATRVAFSVSLSDSGVAIFGPWNDDRTVLFKRILTNIGDAYNPNTGIFTAPVSGVYYFSFTAFAHMQSSSILAGTALYKNGKLVVSVHELHQGEDNHEYASNSAVLELKAKDTVYIHLEEGRMVYDDYKGRTTFAGFLL
ncbi:complement C1q-like protein 2 [Sardina pilchardus]|uniref:complement C1q-like protein 2 n=1 Tax=Sardina pilchardus TaxID=27697 RepID=UPI002E10E7B1